MYWELAFYSSLALCVLQSLCIVHWKRRAERAETHAEKLRRLVGQLFTHCIDYNPTGIQSAIRALSSEAVKELP